MQMRILRLLVLIGLGGLALGLGACSSSQPQPDLAELYDRSAQYHGVERNPVILIPGAMGSQLVDAPTERTVWGAFSGEYANPETPDGARLAALPMEQDKPLRALRDSVRSDGALEQMELDVLGLPIQLDAYVDILQSLGIGGYRDDSRALGDIDYGDEHFTCFQFDYDWRRDNVENAQRLHEFIQEKRAYLQREYEKRYGVEEYDVQFDIVAHSMGGLLARYFLRYGDADLPDDGSTPDVTWAGSDYVDRTVLIGTPNAGAGRALNRLVNGFEPSRFLPDYEPAVLGTMPFLYQLLPRARHGAVVDAADTTDTVDDLFDPLFWEEMGWGLADPAQDDILRTLMPDEDDPARRHQRAIDHLRKSLARAEQFTNALDTPADRPDDLDLLLIAGDSEPTLNRMAVDRATGTLEPFDEAPGDGTVLRTSALMDERLGGAWEPRLVSPIDWTHVTFLFAEHVEMTADPAFTNNLLYYLLVHPS